MPRRTAGRKPTAGSTTFDALCAYWQRELRLAISLDDWRMGENAELALDTIDYGQEHGWTADRTDRRIRRALNHADRERRALLDGYDCLAFGALSGYAAC